MNKAELVQAMADDAGLSKSDAEKALNALAKEADAEIRIGRRCLYKRKKIEGFIENIKEL
jgi:nucleoid DNA-binding protein